MGAGRGGQVPGGRRNRGVGGTREPVDHPALAPLVEQPGAQPRAVQPAEAAEVDAARRQAVEHRGRVVAAHRRDDPHSRLPERRAQRCVEGGAAGLRHPRAAVLANHVVEQQVAEHCQLGRGAQSGARPSAARAATISRRRWGSSGPDQWPSRLSEEPTIQASAAA